MNTDSILIKNFMQEHSKVAAKTLEEIAPEKLADFFNNTPIEWALDVVPHMNPQGMSAVFQRMNQATLVQLFESMELQHAALFIRMMTKEMGNSVLNGLTGEKATYVKELLHYLENSVGSHMDPAVFTLTENLTVKEAIAAIKRNKEHVQPELFVLTSDRKLLGVLPLSALITEDPGKKIKSLTNTIITTLSPETPIQMVLSHPEWQNFYALPVVDRTSLFLGIVRLEEIRSILIQSGDKVKEAGQLTINALGELYRLGLAGLIKSATDIAAPSKE